MRLWQMGSTLAALLIPMQLAVAAPINGVEVQVVDTTGGTSELLGTRMSGSMQVVAEQLFLDKNSEELLPAQLEYERLLGEIADRVFTGYEVRKVDLSLGGRTKAVLYVAPWGQTIKNAVVDLQFSGIEAQTAALLEEKIPALRQKLETTINGASLDASDWASGVLRKEVRRQVEEALPEFKAAVDLVQEKDKTIVQVVIFPVGPVVRQIKYELRSEEIPNLLLLRIKYKYLNECDKLRGLPVEYVKNHRAELEQLLLKKLKTEKDIHNYDLKPEIKIIPGVNLGINVLLNSHDYKIWLEGYGDIGRDKNNLSGKAHVGKFFSRKDEVFGETELVLDHVQWHFGLGYTHYWGNSAWSYTRRIPDADNVYRLEYRFSPKWALRMEHQSGENRNEYGVRYRIHEFLSAEYVYGGKECYLRLIGNL